MLTDIEMDIFFLGLSKEESRRYMNRDRKKREKDLKNKTKLHKFILMPSVLIIYQRKLVLKDTGDARITHLFYPALHTFHSLFTLKLYSEELNELLL